MFGAAAIYDLDGNLVARDDNFRSGGGLLPGETNPRVHTDLEDRVLRWYTAGGQLKPGYTLVITVNDDRPACAKCSSKMTAAAAKTGIRVIYQQPNAEPVVFGKANSAAQLKGDIVTPRAPIKAQAPLFPKPGEPPAGQPVRPRGGGGNTGRGMGGAGTALGAFGLLADLYFLLRYGPCGIAPVPIPQCQPQNPYAFPA